MTIRAHGRTRVLPLAALGLLLAAGSTAEGGAPDPRDPAATEQATLDGWTEPPRLGWDPDAAERPYWRRNLFRRVLADQLFLVTVWWPSEARRPAFAAPVALSLAAAGSTGGRGGGIDRDLQRLLAAGPDAGRSPLAEGFTLLGDGGSAAVFLGGAWLLSRWTGDERLRRASSLSAEALLDAALYSSALKRLTRRTRPASGGTGAFFVARAENGQQANSFPSGHATGAFAVATVFASEYRHRRWVPWVAYGTAGLIAWSRVRLERHFPSDVVAGALLGRSMGRMVIERAGGPIEKRARGELGPWIDPRDRSVGLAYRLSW